MMDRALGAITSSSTAPEGNIEAVNRFGMYYQWGRKDPFTPATTTTYWDGTITSGGSEVQIYKADGTAIEKGTNGISGKPDEEFKLDNTTTTTINHLIQNPSTHYSQTDGTNYVPILSTGDITSDWWNPVIKTIYDPCPYGYRIPKHGTYGLESEWSNWQSSGLKAGRTWTSVSSFFPASGYRHPANGLFYSVGSNGCYWMSTPLNPIHGNSLILIPTSAIPNGSSGRSHGFPTRCIAE